MWKGQFMNGQSRQPDWMLFYLRAAEFGAFKSDDKPPTPAESPSFGSSPEAVRTAASNSPQSTAPAKVGRTAR